MREHLQEAGPQAQTADAPQRDETDEVGMLLAIPPSTLTVERAVRIVEAGTHAERTRLFAILHTLKGNAFVQQVLTAMSPERAGELTAQNGVERPSAEMGTAGGYVPHPYLNAAEPNYDTSGRRYRFTDTPEEREMKQEANTTVLEGSETTDRIAGLERLRETLPKEPPSLALSAAITAELIDLHHDRNLLDADPATKPWIGNRSDSQLQRDLYRDRARTDCTVYVIETLQKACAAIGHPELATQVMHEARAGAKRDRAGNVVFSGVDIQRAMATVLGWKNVHVDTGGSRAGLNRTGDRFYNNAPVDSRISSTEDFEAKRAILDEIPFAVITVNSGGHMKILARGIIYECHWSDTGANLFEASALDAYFSESLFTVPPEYAARLKAIAARG